MMAETISQANHAHRQIVPRNMGKNMHRLRNAEKSFCDLTFQTRDGKQLHAHKDVLVSASDFFVTMFSTEMHERYSDIVEMKNMSSDVLESVINFIYDQPIFISEENVYELTDAAEYLLVADLKTECQTFLLDSTKPSNCLKHRLFGKLYNMKAVIEKADAVIAANFEVISKEKDFNELDFDDLQTILQNKRNKKFEEFVFLAIVTWVKHDMDGRQKFFDSLFLFIKVSLLTERFIETKVLTEDLVNRNCSSVLRISNELMSRIKLKNSYVPRRIGVIGGHNAEKDLVVFDPNEEEVQFLPDMSFFARCPITVTNGDNLYVIDGHRLTMKLLNLKDQTYKWDEVTKMPEPERYQFGCAVLNGYIYVAGGKSDDNTSSSVIKYDLSNNVWSDVKSMSEERKDHALVSLEGNLYAIGGCNEKTSYFKTVEMYDEDHNEWTYVSSLNKHRSLFAATVFNGRIYVTGGRKGQGVYKSDWMSCVEIYDPNENVWMIMTEELNRSRYRHGSCVVGGKLYVVGGAGVKSIEVYDPKDGEWQFCGDLDKKRTFSAVCAM